LSFPTPTGNFSTESPYFTAASRNFSYCYSKCRNLAKKWSNCLYLLCNKSIVYLI